MGSADFEPVWSDAWLLLALVMGKADLPRAIGCADAINKAIPTHEEWHHAMVVLGTRGLIVDGDFVAVASEAGRRLASSVTVKSVAAITELVHEIGQFPPDHPPANVPDPETLHAAFEVYSELFKKQLEKLREWEAE